MFVCFKLHRYNIYSYVWWRKIFRQTPTCSKDRKETEPERRGLSAVRVEHVGLGGTTHTTFLTLDPNRRHGFLVHTVKDWRCSWWKMGVDVYEERALSQIHFTTHSLHCFPLCQLMIQSREEFVWQNFFLPRLFKTTSSSETGKSKSLSNTCKSSCDLTPYP